MNIFGEPISVIKYSFRSFYFIFIILLPVSLNSYFMSFKRSCSSLMVDCWKIGILRPAEGSATIPIGYRRYPISSFPLPSQRVRSKRVLPCAARREDWGTTVRSQALAVIRFTAGVCDRTVVPQRGKSGAPRTTIWEKYLVFSSKTFGSGTNGT